MKNFLAISSGRGGISALHGYTGQLSLSREGGSILDPPPPTYLRAVFFVKEVLGYQGYRHFFRHFVLSRVRFKIVVIFFRFASGGGGRVRVGRGYGLGLVRKAVLRRKLPRFRH